MKDLFNKIADTFPLRLFLNIVFWLVVTWYHYHSNIPDKHVAEINLYKTITLLSLVVYTYANNLILIPRYLRERRFFAYLSFASVLVIGYSFLYSVFVLKVVADHPGIRIYEIVLLSVPMPADWSFNAIQIGTAGYAIIYGIWLFIFTMAWYMYDHARQRRTLLTVLQKQTETELNFLKAQINPHFLFNTLNNLYALALQKSDKSPEAIFKLSSVLRYLLYESNTTTVPFEKEKEIMQAYIDIELLRLEDTIAFEASVTADVPSVIPPLLWLPILENLFKHGARTIADNNDLAFTFEIKNGVLTIYSRNKEKMLTKRDSEGGGIGLKNLEKRLQILYPDAHSIVILQENHHYIATVRINLM